MKHQRALSLVLCVALLVAGMPVARAGGLAPPQGGSGGGVTSAALDTLLGSTRGSVAERGASVWSSVPPSSTAGFALTSNGTGADPTYQAGSSVTTLVPTTGAAATAAGSNSLALGRSSSAAGADSVVIGQSATCGGSSEVVIGRGASDGGTLGANVVIGYFASCPFSGCVCLGYGATSTAANQFVGGGSTANSAYTSDVYFGSGVSDPTPQNYAIHGTASGTNGTSGGSVDLDGGLAHQAADSGGGLNLRVPLTGSGTTLTTLLGITAAGAVNIGASTSSLVGFFGQTAVADALALPSAATVQWNADTFIGRSAAATLLLGVNGTGTNGAGTNQQVNASGSTGNAQGGTLAFALSPKVSGGGSGSSANPGVALLTLSAVENNLASATFAAGAAVTISSITFGDGAGAGTGSFCAARIAPTYNYTNGTKAQANTDLLIARTETSVATGAQNFFDCQLGGTSKFAITNAGVTTLATNASLIMGTAAGTQKLSIGAGTSPTYLLHMIDAINATTQPADLGVVLFDSQGTPRKGGFVLGNANDFAMGSLSNHTFELICNSGAASGMQFVTDGSMSYTRGAVGLAANTCMKFDSSGNCSLGGAASTSPAATPTVTLPNTTCSNLFTFNNGGAVTTSASVFQINSANAGTAVIGTIRNAVTTSSGTSVNLTTAVPAGSVVLSANYRVTTTVTGATANLQLQDASGNVFVTGATLTANTIVVQPNCITVTGNSYTSANTFKMVSTATAFTGGVVEVEIYYLTTTGPTS